MALCRYAFLCFMVVDHGTDQLPDAIGVGVDRFIRDSLPAPASLAVVFRLDFTPNEVPAMPTPRVELIGPSGLISYVAGDLLSNPEGETSIQQSVTFPFTATEYGRHWFAVSLGEDPLARLPLDVLHT